MVMIWRFHRLLWWILFYYYAHKIKHVYEILCRLFCIKDKELPTNLEILFDIKTFQKYLKKLLENFYFVDLIFDFDLSNFIRHIMRKINKRVLQSRILADIVAKTEQYEKWKFFHFFSEFYSQKTRSATKITRESARREKASNAWENGITGEKKNSNAEKQ